MEHANDQRNTGSTRVTALAAVCGPAVSRHTPYPSQWSAAWNPVNRTDWRMDGRSEACDVWDVGTAGDVRPASTDAMRAQRWIEEVWEGKEKKIEAALDFLLGRASNGQSRLWGITGIRKSLN